MPSLKKKILYVIPYFVPAFSFGGSVKVTYDFAKELTRLGYDVTVATTDVLDSNSRNKKLSEKIDKINIVRFKNLSNKLARNLNFYTPIGFNKWLKQNIEKFDIVHIHELFTYQTIVAGSICRKKKKKYFLQPHGSLFLTARKSRFYLLKSFIIKKLAPLVTFSSAIIALNEKEKRNILKVYPLLEQKIKIVPNGLDMNEFKSIKKIDLYKQYCIPQKNKIIAFIGRIKFVKGLDISLKVLANLKDKLNFTFLIIGPDEGEKDNLEALAKTLNINDRVIFAGLMSGVKKLQTLKSADLSLLNSRSEGLPTTLLESAALGLPVVCSRESNLPELDFYHAGFIVRNVKESADKIKQILTNDYLRKKLSCNALKLAGSFDLKKCAQTLRKIYGI